MFFTMFLVIDYVINLRMIMRIFPSVILISHFNIFCDSKFIFYVKNMICFLMNIQIWTKNPVRDAILVLAKITIFLSIFCFIFGFLFWVIVFFQDFYVVKLFLFGHKDREIDVFRYKTLW